MQDHLTLFKEPKILSLKPPLLKVFSQEVFFFFSLSGFSWLQNPLSSPLFKSPLFLSPLPLLNPSNPCLPHFPKQDLIPPFLFSHKHTSFYSDFSLQNQLTTSPKLEVRWWGREPLNGIKCSCKWLDEEACASPIRRAPDH